ncbi:MAG: archaeoflavoprotein AfpA [Candidatus Bathyarchaeota archaeon]|nr:MAG: archaeoflavoprotein AfpA [Candidatus Bathyarchaeota archaeon]
MTLKIAWGITGSGDRLAESVEVMETLQRKYKLNIHVIFSKAGEMVAAWYKLWDSIKESFDKILIESTANTPFLIGPLQLGKYDFLLLCPATANTTAKIAHGIADSLLTNCVAQAMKADIPVFIFPVDQKTGEVVTVLPSKKRIALHMREIDVENAEKLRRMKGITVLSSPKEVEPVILGFLENKREA